ncbi:MAG: valine--tRNA ligase [Desulfurococcales archaeon]|nr:valine--tRNA ligase [Desulfurococcales archaeon]
MSSFKPRIKEKRWSIEIEKELIKTWDEEGIYKPSFDPDDPRPILAIDTPPPYASGKWHVAGAAHYAQIDMVARYFRLKGYNVIVPFYADRNGLPVEVQVEKTYGVYAHEMAKTPEGRERFLNLCREFLDKAESEIVGVWRRMGCSFDYWRDGTDSPTYRVLTQASFIELYKKGLIYEDFRPVRWCPRCRTTLAEAEVEHREEEGYLYYITYKLKDNGRDLVVATTRPELLAGCAALAYNPEDERYKGLKGKKAIAPIYGHEVDIIEHPAVDPNYGTGLMMICSFGDEEDVRLFNELGLKPKWLIDPDGSMRSEAGPIAGLKVDEARKKIVEMLEKEGLLVKKEKIIHKVPICWRCKTPLQIIYRKEYFLKQMEYKDDIRRIASEIDFKPEMHRRKLYDWIDSISMDWPISRDRYYATEIPLWTCKKCGSKLVPEPGRYYQPWKMDPPWDKCPNCGAPKEYLEGEKRVFDTWFDSSLSVLYVTRWMNDKKFFEKAMENTLRPQGQDIIRTWLYYSLLRVYQLTGKKAFRWVRITGMGLDPKGRPMHKSLGNVIDPDPVIDQYGADAFRFWSAIAAKLGYDYRFDENKIKTGRNFVTKLWNLARFVSAFPEPEDYKLELIDRAFIALQDKYLEEADEAYSGLDVYVPITKLYEFAWDIYASHYVELSKNRAYNRDSRYSGDEQKSAWASLHIMLRRTLIALSPIMPFVTDYAFRKLYGVSVHLQRYPEPMYTGEEREKLARLALKIIELNKAIWGYKRERGLKLVDPIEDAVVYVPEEMSAAIKDIEAMHKIKVETYTGNPPEGAKEIGDGFYIVEVK